MPATLPEELTLFYKRIKLNNMRKYFFSAMALVLGLFTVVAVSAFGVKAVGYHLEDGDIYYFNHDDFNPSTQWGVIAAWDLGDESPGCPGDDDILCRIRLEKNQSLPQFLTPIQSYGALVDEDQVDLKEEE